MPNHSEKKSEDENPESKTLYEQIEELAEVQFSVKEIAIIVEHELNDLENDADAKRAYNRGSLKAEAEVRRAMLQMAKQGSTPAQKQFMELVTSKTAAANNWFE